MTESIRKRSLSEEEIDSILSGLEDYAPRFLPEDARTCFLSKIVSPLREQLSQARVIDDPRLVETLRRELHLRVQKSIAPPGEGVGVICAQSIGERQTQLTLNSFHQSGLTVATVVTGVPRFLELLNATKEPKMSSVRFQLRKTSNREQTPAKIRSVLSHHLVCLYFKDLVVSDAFHLHKEDEVWYDAFETIYSNRFRDFSTCVSFTLDIRKMHQYRLPPYKIAQALEQQYSDICCVFSPIHIGQLDVYVDTTQVVLPEDVVLPSFVSSQNCVQIFLEDVVKPKLMEVRVCGLSGISNYYIQKGDDGFFVETEGSVLGGIAALPFVDITTCRSNNMWDVFRFMGIEATREFLIEEFTMIVSSDGTFLHPVHILLLVDIMTHHGTINSVSRYGLKKEQVGVLSRSSFEESLDHFCNAGFYSEKEPIRAVSAAIMCGKRSKIGSGLCSLLVDWKKIQSLRSADGQSVSK